MIAIDQLAINLSPEDLFNKLYPVLQTQPGNALVFTILRERTAKDLEIFYQDLEIFLQITRSNFSKPIVMILNSWWSPFEKQLESSVVKYQRHYINYFLVETWYNSIVRKITPVSTRWNYNSQKFLFLTGSKHRANRTLLLYKFWKAGLLNHAIWSWFLTDLDGRSQIPELTEIEYLDFITAVFNRPDNFDGTQNQNYDISLFADSLFQVVSEADFDRPVYNRATFFTEKIFKCIINRVPFIVAANHHYLRGLRDLGFENYQQFLLISNIDEPYENDYLAGLDTEFDVPNWEEFYQLVADPSWPVCSDAESAKNLPDHILTEIKQHLVVPTKGDTELRLTAILQNTQFWLDNLKNYQSEVAVLVDKNYNTLEQLAYKNIADFENFCNQVKLDCSIDQLVAGYGFAGTTPDLTQGYFK